MLKQLKGPQSIAAQIIVLVAISAFIFHACIGLAVYFAQKTAVISNPVAIELIADVVNALELLPPDRRAQYVERISTIHPELSINLVKSPEQTEGVVGGIVTERLAPLLPGGSSVAAADAGRVVITTREGLTIEATIPRAIGEPPPLGNVVLGTLLFVATSVTLFLLWGIRTITMPLGAFAKAVDRFALDQKNELLAERGSLEVNTASRAFNRMQLRIKTMMEDRTRMLASIGHDLRTPITRLRLRAEFIGDPTIRSSIVGDLDHMDSMVHAALSFLRDGAPKLPKTSIDLASLLQMICDEAADMGHSVVYLGPNHLIIDGHLDELRRGVTNLVSNATFYGQTVTVEVCANELEWVEIEVVDDGPGILDSEKQIVFEPFLRGSSASSKSAGFGLGLSIVSSVAAMHGGSVSLHDKPGGGLVSRLRLRRK